MRARCSSGRALDLRGLPPRGAEHAHGGQPLEDVQESSAHPGERAPEPLVALVRLVADHDHAQGKEHGGENEHEPRDPVQREDHGEDREGEERRDGALGQVARVVARPAPPRRPPSTCAISPACMPARARGPMLAHARDARRRAASSSRARRRPTPRAGIPAAPTRAQDDRAERARKQGKESGRPARGGRSRRIDDAARGARSGGPAGCPRPRRAPPRGPVGRARANLAAAASPADPPPSGRRVRGTGAIANDRESTCGVRASKILEGLIQASWNGRP